MVFSDKFMQTAIEEGVCGVKKSDGGPFGAVVVCGNEVVAEGHNMVLVTNDPTAHAEVTAIRNATAKLGRFNLSDCVMYASCYPCPMCMGAILWAGIKHVYYAGTSLDAEEAGFGDKVYHDFLKNPESGTLTKLEHVDNPEKLKPFETWLNKEDRNPY